MKTAKRRSGRWERILRWRFSPSRRQPLFNYFKQLFAQVTNPPLDAIREELVTSVFTGAGAEANLLDPGPENCRQIALEMPILDNDELARIKQLNELARLHDAHAPDALPCGRAGRRAWPRRCNR